MLEYVSRNRPATIHISGKTSTGKSSLAKELEKLFEYKVVELDQILINEVVKNNSAAEGVVFVEVYKNRKRLDWIERFISATKRRLNELHSSNINVVIDGAVAHPQTLKEILCDSNAIIIYLHPESLETYIRNLTSRFLTATRQSNAGLPIQFWDKVPDDDFLSFLNDKQLSPNIKKAIEIYAKESQIESTKRLGIFQDNFTNLLVVNI